MPTPEVKKDFPVHTCAGRLLGGQKGRGLHPITNKDTHPQASVVGSILEKSCRGILDCSMPGFLSFTISLSLLKLMSTVSVMPSNQLILCHPLLLPPSIFPRVFSIESVLCIRWPKDWSFSFSISPFSEHSGLISFRKDWLDLLAIQGSLMCPL